MTNEVTNTVEVVFIMDKSGSMDTIRKDAIGGYNTFTADQQKVKGDVNFTLATFSSGKPSMQLPIYRESIKNIKPLTENDYRPSGGTALNDAIGRTLTEFMRMKREGKVDKVIVSVLTDGEENASEEFTTDQIKALIKQCEQDYSWEFVFLAANQDAFQQGGKYGFSYANTANFANNAVGAASAFSGVSMKATAYRSASAAGLSGEALYSVTRNDNLQDTVVDDTAQGTK